MSLAHDLLAPQTFLTKFRYLSQVRQELAMRLLARVYADGNTPSKVSVFNLSVRIGITTDNMTVVAEFHEAQIYGKITIVAYFRYWQELQLLFETVQLHTFPRANLQDMGNRYDSMYKVSVLRTLAA